MAFPLGDQTFPLFVDRLKEEHRSSFQAEPRTTSKEEQSLHDNSSNLKRKKKVSFSKGNSDFTSFK